MRAYNRRRRTLVSSSGMALLMVIWLIALLMTMVVSLCLVVKADVASAAASSAAVKGRFIARAGLEKAISELIYRGQEGERQDISRIADLWVPDGRLYTGKMGDDSYAVRVCQESGKIQLNALTDANGIMLLNLLARLGVPVEKGQVVVDSILDWKDYDEAHRLSGAESSYYLSLPVPHQAKNGPFDTLEELLLVRGMTRDILFGSGEKPGLVGFLTIFGRDDKINVNLAPRELLTSVPGLTPEVTDSIIEYRSSRPIGSLEEVKDLIGSAYALALPYLTTTESNLYSVDSAAMGRNGKESFRVRAVIAIDGRSSWRYLYYKAPA